MDRGEGEVATWGFIAVCNRFFTADAPFQDYWPRLFGYQWVVNFLDRNSPYDGNGIAR